VHSCVQELIKRSYEKLLVELGWETLQTRRKHQRLVLMYKIQNSLTPAYLSNMIPAPRGQTSAYNLRNSNNLSMPFCRTMRYKSSFVPLTILDWNALPAAIKNNNTLGTFKSKLKEHLFKNKSNKLHQYGQTNVNKYHTWLRLGLSPLREHLFSHHIIDDATCNFCTQEPETSTHYLCRCPTFTLQRARLFRSIANIIGDEFYSYPHTMLTRLLLHGESQLSVQQNKEIFKATHHYFTSSKRFTYTSGN